MKTQLENLGQSLLKVHRSLLDIEKQIQENKDQERMNASTLLQNCINHPNFRWLRDISSTISDIDQLVDQRREIQNEVYQRLKDLFLDEEKYPEVKEKIQMAIQRDPHFTMDLAILRSQITKFIS